jgi:alkanesulfonate monooxygenase SsuD/methylene tetrahydromethanopterin reductase-like flavin-dependent oxidoreductase (luciferase family)
VVRKLWDSWEDEAFAVDKPSGMFVDPHRVHPIHHEGASFTVRGPLNVPRPPQGNPVLLLSDPATSTGRRFAAATADVILMDCKSLSDSGVHYRELRSLAKEHERVPLLLANLRVVLGETEIAARRRAADLDALVSPDPRGTRFIGTPEQLIAWFASWQEQCGCDGFNLMPAVLPDDLDLLADKVVPLARRHGLFRADYVGETLRDHLGLTHPPSQYAES